MSIEPGTGTMQTDENIHRVGNEPGSCAALYYCSCPSVAGGDSREVLHFQATEGNADICKDVNLSGINGLELWAGNGLPFWFQICHETFGKNSFHVFAYFLLFQS